MHFITPGYGLLMRLCVKDVIRFNQSLHTVGVQYPAGVTIDMLIID